MIERLPFNEAYPKILKLVEEGWNIREASESYLYGASAFYRKATEKQKTEIYYAKKLHSGRDMTLFEIMQCVSSKKQQKKKHK